MTNLNTDTIDTGMVTVDLFDVAELAVICEFLADWLGGAPPAVEASLACFAGPDAPAVLLDALAHLAGSLRRAVSSPRPVPTPLAGDETASPADLLVEAAGTLR